MNIRYTIGLLTAICLVACSGNDDMRNGAQEEQELTMEQMVSDVPIEFAPVDITDMQWEAGEVSATRGGSVDVDDFTMDSLGIFCLARKKQADGPMNPLWDGSNKTYKKYHIWENNVEASVIGTGNGKGAIQWGKEFQLHFYPSQAWYTYGFVAYHPWTDHLIFAKKAITAYFKLDGNDDVIHALASEPDKTFGIDEVDGLVFSKQYYDEIRTRGLDPEGTYPVLRFRRLTSRLDFYFCLDGNPTQNIHVEKVEFNDFPSVMTFSLVAMNNTTGVMTANIPAKPYVLNKAALAALNYDANTTLLEKFPDLAPCFDHFELREKGETPISGIKVGSAYKYNLTTEMKKVGDCILIPPVAKDHTKRNIQLFVTLCDDNGTKYKNKVAIPITCPDTGWLMGKRYEIRITLNNPMEVGATSTPLTGNAQVDPGI